MSRAASPADVVAAASQIAVEGERSIPVFPVVFSNTSKPPFDRSALQTRLFGAGADTMTAFYKENSFNRLTVNGTVAEWHKLPSIDTFYEGADFIHQGKPVKCNGTCEGAKLGDMMKHVLDGADGTVDFRQFDNDGPDGKPNSGDDDGFVDFVAFVQPNVGGECGSDNRHIWSHRWSLSGWNAPPYDHEVRKERRRHDQGGRLRHHALEACDGTTMIQIGVFAHEFGHAFGLPDLYDTDDANGVSEGAGNWCLMASGSWGGDGQPAAPGPYVGVGEIVPRLGAAATRQQADGRSDVVSAAGRAGRQDGGDQSTDLRDAV